MKITKRQLQRIIKEELSFNERFGLAKNLRNAVRAELESHGRHILRSDSAEIDNLMLQIVDLSKPSEDR